ncbi:MAG: chromosome segregation protein SMC [Candidatus Omnitrophota bacterium]
MYFKQLEIAGFKSFPYKTKLKFEPGVTAIVGPNGCGKSNISDAIRWVLGEQSSKALRGSSMEDVIFNGTDAVEPTNMAEVSLTFSNEDKVLPIDYDEVTITRRLFRSGESEYILNKTPVRLKDISTLLMGTGMGTDSYSIIEQGKIGMILSSKPEDRRHIFEEASGITKYKTKKKEALKKLEHTENNLVRINDIIAEVKRQINSIERHAKKAERYKEDFEVMKELDLKVTVRELREIKSELNSNKEKLEFFSQKENSLKTELVETISSINKYREDLDLIIRDLSETQQKFSQTTLSIEKSTHKVEMNKERIDDLASLKKSSEEEKTLLITKVKDKEAEIRGIERHFDEILNAKEEGLKNVGQKEEAISDLMRDSENHQREIKKAKESTVNLLALQTNTKNELIKMGADLQNKKVRERRLRTEKENIEQEKKKIETSLQEAHRALEASEEKVQKSRYALDEFNTRLDLRKVTLEDIKKDCQKDTNFLNSLCSKEEVLKEMIENFEGFGAGVKVIMEASKSGLLSGIFGTVADMIEPHDGFESALEAALGATQEAIVIENEDALEKSLHFLEGKGSAHFLLNNSIKNQKSSSRYRSFMEKKGFSHILSHLNLNDSIKDFGEYLFSEVYVAESVSQACEMLRNNRIDVKFVTKEGFFIEKGHVFGGTINRDSTSIIGRRKRLEEIAREKIRLEVNIDGFKARQSEQEIIISELNEKIAHAENDLKKEEIAFAGAVSGKERVTESLNRINDEASVIELEIGETNELINEISEKGGSLNLLLNDKEAECAKLQEFIASSQDIIQEHAERKNNILIEISKIKSELNFLETTELQEAKNLEKENEMLGELKGRYEAKKRDYDLSEEKILALQEESMDLSEKIVLWKETEKELSDSLKEISEKKEIFSRDLHEREKSLREKEISLNKLKDEVRNLEISVRENELIIINIKDRTRQTYKLDIEAVDVEIDESANWEEIKNHVEVLKIKLEKLGPVNLVAIEEHKELEERYSFLTKQEEDLTMAKESLHKAILKINKTTKELFIDAFQKIQVEFRSYFKMLFGGGHAELILMDEGDVLESGIEIVARPPGKKLQNLLLLSGGEKALTAIALLFAIFKVKPSPFCILDEVDAPLDETNIGRFSTILQDFLKTSQFIVITHSKRSMQMANILYGITMQEKGVSKIVSVKFSDDEKKSQDKEKVLV